MKNRKNLRNGIQFIFFSIWLVIFTMQIIYIHISYKNTLKDEYVSFTNSMVSAHSLFEKKIQTSSQLAKSFVYNSVNVEYFRCSDTMRRQVLWSSLITPLQYIYENPLEKYNIIAFNAENELLNTTNNTDSQLSAFAKQALDQYNSTKTPLVICNTNDSAFESVYFFYFNAISIPSTYSIQTNYLGTMAIAGKINKSDLIVQSALPQNTNVTIYNKIEDSISYLTIPNTFAEHNHFVWKQSIYDSNWILCGELVTKTSLSASIILLVAETLFMSLLFLFMNQYIKYTLITPLYNISNFLNSYTIVQKGKRLQLNNNTELGDIADKINNMIATNEQLSRSIVQTQQQLYESELAKRDASLYALQAQLNPHFMYNTLNCICGIANFNNIPLIADATIALSKMLRYNLSQEKSVLLTQEIEMLKNYFIIMEIRRPDFFTAEFNIEPEVENFYCLKSILQPLLENTFKHGFNGNVKNAHIIIDAYKHDSCLVVTIFDNGHGISKEKLDLINNQLSTKDFSFYTQSEGKIHIGLINIQNRIKLNYGNRFGLKIESRENEFTKITITLPILHHK